MSGLHRLSQSVRGWGEARVHGGAVFFTGCFSRGCQRGWESLTPGLPGEQGEWWAMRRGWSSPGAPAGQRARQPEEPVCMGPCEPGLHGPLAHRCDGCRRGRQRTGALRALHGIRAGRAFYLEVPRQGSECAPLCLFVPWEFSRNSSGLPHKECPEPEGRMTQRVSSGYARVTLYNGKYSEMRWNIC